MIGLTCLKMKSCLYLSSIITFHSVIICIPESDYDEEPLWRREQLTAVTSYDGIEDLFMELHGRKMDAENADEKDSFRSEGVNKLDSSEDNLGIKKRLCKNIFNSFHFENENIYLVNPEKKTIRSQLKDQNNIYEDLFKKTEKKKRFPGDKSFKEDFKNYFKKRNLSIVSYGRDVNVFMFSCLIKKRGNDGFQQFFISEDYNMSPASYKSSSARPIAGRFIFGPIGQKNALEIKAVAQEPAKSLPWPNKTFIEFSFLDKKLSHSTAETFNTDAICKLSLGQRLRLCVSIFSMSYFGSKYKFESSTDSVPSPCTKRAVSFKGEIIKQEAGRKIFEEFMIPCKPTLVGTEKNTDALFYISRAYVHDKVFLFHNRNDKIFLEHYVYGTGVAELDAEKIAKLYGKDKSANG